MGLHGVDSFVALLLDLEGIECTNVVLMRQSGFKCDFLLLIVMFIFGKECDKIVFKTIFLYEYNNKQTNSVV
jgi:hypothetical protein